MEHVGQSHPTFIDHGTRVHILFSQGFEDPDLLAALPGFSNSIEGDDSTGVGSEASPDAGGDSESKEEARSAEECALLERAAHYALMMNADLQVRNPFSSPSNFLRPQCRMTAAAAACKNSTQTNEFFGGVGKRV